MAINSFGYPDSIAPGSTFARWARHAAGRRYAVPSHTEFRVTAATSGTRRVNIAPGYAAGQGVLVQNTATINLDLPAPSGSSQWMIVGINRWVADGESYQSTVGYVAATAAREVPALEQDPGTADFQALALCRVTSSSSLVVDVVDLRGIAYEAGNFYTCHNELAMGLLGLLSGVVVYRSDIDQFFHRVVSPSGVGSWRNVDEPEVVKTGNSFIAGPAAPGWITQSQCRLVMDEDWVWVHIVLEKNGGQIVSSPSGGLGSDHELLCELDTGYSPKPGVAVAGAGYCENDSGIMRGGGGRLGADGVIRFTATSANFSVRTVTLDFFYSRA